MGILNGNLQCEKGGQNFTLSIKIWTMIMCMQGLHICILSCNLVVLSLMNVCHYYQLILLWPRPMSENSIAWLSLNKMMCGEFALMNDLLCWMWLTKSTKDGDGWWSWALEEVTFLSLLLFYFSYVLLFSGYEHWFVVLHGVLMFRSNVGDGALFSWFFGCVKEMTLHCWMEDDAFGL
jgi:hypothetical protein